MKATELLEEIREQLKDYPIEYLRNKVTDDRYKDPLTKKLAKYNSETWDEIFAQNISEAVVELFYTENCFYKYDNLISERWGQSPLVNAAFSYLYQNDPSSTVLKEIVNYIYFADIIQCYKEKSVDYYQINKNILDTFGIDSESKLLYIIKQIDSVLKD